VLPADIAEGQHLNLNLRQIEVFRAIMLTGSIKAAAKLLHLSQPAVSRHMAYAEHRLGLTLFKRTGGRLFPTPEAHRLFTEATAVYEGVHRFNDVANDLIENRGGHLRLACSPSLGQWLIPRAVTRFCQRFPDVRIVLNTLLPETLLQAVLNQQVELGIAYLQDTHPKVHIRPLYENRLVAALPAGHPLAAREVLHISDLSGQPFIGFGNDVPFGRLLRTLFQEAGGTFEVKIEVQQAHVARALVQAGSGITLIDELTASGPAWPDIVVRPITPTVAAPVSLLYQTLEPLSRLAQEFITTLETMRTAP
jgi:DNA-binding transcriptional LysR family regulator